MKKPASLFSKEDRSRIEEAIAKAELETSGEIVPYVVGHSDPYPEAPWRAGALAGLFALCVFSVLNFATDLWLPFGIAEVAVIAALAFAAGALAVLAFPPLKRLFVHPAALQQRVDERAAMAFLSEEVFKTRERTGILIFLSLFERRVRVMGDSGINAKVKQEEWDGVVRIMVEGMKSGTPAAALCDAIARCGDLLNARGVDIRPDDANELANTVRIEDE
jgi:putative membrane protein